MLHADAGALDMPARITNAPWTIPFQFLVIEFGLGKPQYKITLVALIFILRYVITDTYHQLFFALAGEYIIII